MAAPRGAGAGAGVLLAGAILTATAGVAPVAAQETAAGTAAATVRSLPWGSSCESWAAEHGTECERYRGDGSVARSVDLWCHRARDPRTGGVAYFHLVDPAVPACGLTEYAWQADVTPASEGLSGDLERRLTATFRAPERPERADGFGSYWWRNLRLYRAPGVEVLLHEVVDRTEKTLRVQLRARSDARLGRLESPPGYLAHRDLLRPPSPDSLLAAALDRGTPGLDLLARPLNPESPPQPELHALRALLLRVDAGGPDTPALLLLANRLVDRVAEWASRQEDRARHGPIVRAVEDLGLRLEYSPLGAAFANPGDLLLRLWREHPGTPFGQLAFVRLQSSGWDPTGMCSGGADAFRDVIREGEAFVEAYPGSPVAPTVLLTLALANETWWSLSQAGERDEYVAPAAYAEGADQARRTAIVRYRELTASYPSPEARAYIRDHLALLELGLDTNQRAFYCVYD